MIQNNNRERQSRRKLRIRKRIRGSAARPRLTVSRSLKHIYAQLIDDESGKTLVAASSLSKDVKSQASDSSKPIELGKLVGKLLAQKAIEKNITVAIFDRNGFLYHGRVSAVAEGAREGGLKF